MRNLLGLIPLILTRGNIFKREQRKSLLPFKPSCRLLNVRGVPSYRRQKKYFFSQFHYNPIFLARPLFIPLLVLFERGPNLCFLSAFVGGKRGNVRSVPTFFSLKIRPWFSLLEFFCLSVILIFLL